MIMVEDKRFKYALAFKMSGKKKLKQWRPYILFCFK